MSQSIFGCSKLTNARARALSIAFIWAARGGEKSTLNSLPHLRESLDRSRHEGLQLLGEKLYAQFLEQPAELIELRIAAARFCLLGLFSQPLRAQGPEFRGEPRVAAGIGSQLVEPQSRSPQIARKVLQPLIRRLLDEPFGEKSDRALTDVAARLGKRLGSLLQFFLKRRVLGENCSCEPGDFLRKQRDARARFVAAPVDLGARARPRLLHAGTLESCGQPLLPQLGGVAEGRKLQGHRLQPGQVFLDIAD